MVRSFPLLCLVALAWLTFSPAPRAEEIEVLWSFAEESAETEAVGDVQARASIYRGDHLLALRCHEDGERRWETLLFSATWFLQPKANPVFTIQVDEGDKLEFQFQRLTDFQFSLTSPPPRLLTEMIAGKALHIGGPDYQGKEVTIPLDGSGDAIAGAFKLCGYELPAN